MAATPTNEERFIASCKNVGEADVRQKLSAGRYSERRADWAANWLEQLENGKSDATKDEERSSRLRSSRKPRSAVAGIALVLLAAAVLAGWGALVFLR